MVIIGWGELPVINHITQLHFNVIISEFNWIKLFGFLYFGSHTNTKFNLFFLLLLRRPPPPPNHWQQPKQQQWLGLLVQFHLRPHPLQQPQPTIATVRYRIKARYIIWVILNPVLAVFIFWFQDVLLLQKNIFRVFVDFTKFLLQQ